MYACKSSLIVRLAHAHKFRSHQLVLLSRTTFGLSSLNRRYLVSLGSASCKSCNDSDVTNIDVSTTVPPTKILKSMLHVIWPGSNPKARFCVLGAVGLLVAAKISSVSIPFFFKYAVDSLSQMDNIAYQAPLLLSSSALMIGYGIARVSSSFFSESRNALFAAVTQESVRNVAKSVFKHLHNLDLQFHRRRQTGALVKAVDRGTRGISFVLNAIVFNIFPLLFELALVCSLLWINYGASYAGVALATVGTYSVYTLLITRWRTQFRIEMNRADNDAGNLAVDSLLNFETVKLFNNENFEVERYDDQLRLFEKASLKTQTSLALLNFGQSTIFTCGLTAIMLLTISGVKSGAITVGDMVAVNGLLMQLSFPLNFLGSVYREVRQSLVDMHTMFSLLEIKPTVADSIGAFPLIINPENSAIVFDNVYFSYEPGQRVLQGISFEVPSKSKIAFVGPTGSGKSTIARLICRFFDPLSGRILINGQDVRDVTVNSLRSAISVVPQDCVLLHDTVYENIRYGRLSASRAEVEHAAVAAQIHDAIMQMPKQYETMVGERGLKLAGGEKQRIAIARAILKGSGIFLYDEATSNLDALTENSIMEALSGLSQGKTSLFIAHRLSTVMNCDLIYVLRDGRIVEQGNHHELIATPESHYAMMWQKQRIL